MTYHSFARYKKRPKETIDRLHVFVQRQIHKHGSLVVHDAYRVERDVDDLMTEGGLHREYNHFLNMFPVLTEFQKTQVVAYLKEAREHAMDTETSKERNQWFIKYRGRANNFLAAAGYNLRKATEDLESRQANRKK